MDIMEEGNLTDRVRILLQRDKTYYNENQKILQENLCKSVIGGILDFPSVSSFAATKLVTWWDREYEIVLAQSADLNGDKVKDTAQATTIMDFVSMVSQSAKRFIDHLHMLTQEALDHADLKVLIATIGSANLIKNQIYIYNRRTGMIDNDNTMKQTFKMYKEMSEALAERLLDLHCRLISLYILQDVDCLNWEADHPFFEGEMSSFTIRMWWFHMQGIQDDLWNTVPSTTAVQVLKGTLNESLTILTSRYSKAKANFARNPLIVADISNLLLCVYKLLPAVAESTNEVFGTKIHSYDICDIHIKCHYLFCHMILRGASLSILYKIFKEDPPLCFQNESADVLNNKFIQPWFIFSALQDGEDISPNARSPELLHSSLDIKFNMLVLISHPQLNYASLTKVLLMHSCWVLHDILQRVMNNAEKYPKIEHLEKCNGFLCSGNCIMNICEIEEAIIRFLIILGVKEIIENTLIKILHDETTSTWAIHFDHSQIWNQNKPRWVKGMLFFADEISEQAIKFTPDNQSDKWSDPQTIAHRYITDIITMADCLPEGFITIASLIENILPADVHPLGDSSVMQLLITSLYNKLGNDNPVAEALCHLTFDKHIEQLQSTIQNNEDNYVDISSPSMFTIAANRLMEEHIGKISCMVIYNYIKNEYNMGHDNKQKMSESRALLYKMFHIGDTVYDQVLSGSWKPNWMTFVKMKLGLTKETTWNILSLRPEFWCSDNLLSKHDFTVVNHFKKMFTTENNKSNI